MTEARAQEQAPRERGLDARAENPIVDPVTGPLELAAETFGHILPDTGTGHLRHRERPVTTLVVLAVTLASVGLIVSWFGPWGGGLGVIGAIVALITQLRHRARRTWCVAAYAIGATALLFSCYWVWWILDELAKLTPAP